MLQSRPIRHSGPRCKLASRPSNTFSGAERRERLELLARAFEPPYELSPLVEPSSALMEQMADGRLEGVVLKQRAAPYREGIRGEWSKVKDPPGMSARPGASSEAGGTDEHGRHPSSGLESGHAFALATGALLAGVALIVRHEGCIGSPRNRRPEKDDD
jgi:hypothetical protein